jgi:ABC-type Fe3+ transport system permease subunit
MFHQVSAYHWKSSLQQILIFFSLWFNHFMDTGANDSTVIPTQSSIDPREERKRRLIIAAIVIVVIIAVVVFILFMLFLLNPALSSSETVARVRDVFIIMMALESLLTGLVLTILIVQLARLTNLLENEVKPILNSTNETVSNLRGTTKFLSDNMVEPVIKINEFLAVLQRATDILHISRRK